MVEAFDGFHGAESHAAESVQVIPKRGMDLLGSGSVRKVRFTGLHMKFRADVRK